MPGVVSDSSPLIRLAGIGKLELLREFFGTISIPPAVQRETVAAGGGRAGAVEVQEAIEAGWVKVVSLSDDALLGLLRRELDDGEAEAIALAVAAHADLILLDESDARRVADVLGLRKTGVVGLLMRARLQSRLASLRRELDRLREDTGFWMSDDLYRRALLAVGEDIE